MYWGRSKYNDVVLHIMIHFREINAVRNEMWVNIVIKASASASVGLFEKMMTCTQEEGKTIKN